jgi:hypothetical protein
MAAMIGFTVAVVTTKSPADPGPMWQNSAEILLTIRFKLELMAAL